MKVGDLREVQKLNIDVKGKKDELIGRIIEAQNEPVGVEERRDDPGDELIEEEVSVSECSSEGELEVEEFEHKGKTYYKDEEKRQDLRYGNARSSWCLR